MGSKNRIKEWIASLRESLGEQEWFQQLKGKWEELDPQSRTYLKIAVLLGTFLSVCLVVLSAMWKVHTLRNELFEKKALLSVIQSANDELTRLRDVVPSSALGNKDKESPAWPVYFENTAMAHGIEKSNIAISTEKPGMQSEQNKEALFDLSVKRVNVKQLVKLIFALEGGQKPIKLRNLLIESKDASGYLDATLALSAFIRVEP